MERADKLLTDGIVLTMNRAMDQFVEGAVAVRGDSIVAVGPARELRERYAADEVLSCAGKVILPGLVNAHTHAPMTLLRGIADDLRLDVWLMGYMMPTEAQFVNPEFCRLGTLLACAEMIQSGITCFADMYYFESDVAAAAAQAGMRAVCGESVLKFPAPDAASYEESLAYTRKFIQDWQGHPLIVPAVAPHAPYTCTDEILAACVEIAREFDAPLLLHVAETRLEVEDSYREFDMSVVPRITRLGVLDVKTLAAHCVHIDSSEIKALAHHGTGVAHCPTSNLKLASGIAPVAEMLEKAVKLGIGTDGPASNNDLDMFEEMRLAAILAKGATLDPTVLPAKQALTMATRLGAEAMYLGHLIGSLEPGKRADVIVIDRSPLHNTPAFEREPDSIYGQVVYAAKSTDVLHVMVNGQWLMRERKLLTVDEAKVAREATALARQIDSFLLAREGNVLNKLIAIGGVEQRETFEIQVKALLPDPAIVDTLLKSPDVQVVRRTHYRQYDTYFIFADESQGRIRYREDDSLKENGEVEGVRTRLTYTSSSKDREFDDAVLLSRSQFIAPALRPLRFYREYFRPAVEREFQKERRRWHILYKGILFYVNIDTVDYRQIVGTFAEIKSQTWSKRDAEYKAVLVSELLAILGLTPEKRVRKEYIELAVV